MLCEFCNESITSETPSCNVGGRPMHCSCEAEYSEELYDAFPIDFDDDLCDADLYGYDDDGRYDDDPSPYDGTYSEM